MYILNCLIHPTVHHRMGFLLKFVHRISISSIHSLYERDCHVVDVVAALDVAVVVLGSIVCRASAILRL